MNHERVDFKFTLLEYEGLYLTEWDYSEVRFPFWHLYWAKESDCGLISCENGRLALGPDYFLLVSPDTIISSHLKRPFYQFYCHFTLNIPYFIVPKGIFNIKMDSLDKEFLKSAEEVNPLNMTSFKKPLEIGRLVYNAIMRLPLDTFNPKPVLENRIVDLLEHMERNISQNLTNDKLAGVVNMSRNAFLRLFRSQTGCAPQKYLTRMRVERSCFMLQLSSKTIDEIAEETGFYDRYHFSRTFKKAQKISPVAYRKMLR
jgi:AraC-like DNA-binding protein